MPDTRNDDSEPDDTFLIRVMINQSALEALMAKVLSSLPAPEAREFLDDFARSSREAWAGPARLPMATDEQKRWGEAGVELTDALVAAVGERQALHRKVDAARPKFDP